MSFLFFLFTAALSAADMDNNDNVPQVFKDCSDYPELVVAELVFECRESCLYLITIHNFF